MAHRRHRRLRHDHDLPRALADIQRPPDIHRRRHAHPVAPADRLLRLAGLGREHRRRDLGRQLCGWDELAVDRQLPVTADVDLGTRLGGQRRDTRENGGG